MFDDGGEIVVEVGGDYLVVWDDLVWCVEFDYVVGWLCEDEICECGVIGFENDGGFGK